MAGSVNRVILIGNVGKDPDIRKTQAGKPIASFSIATSERWKDAAGNPQETTDWHNVVCFNEKLCEVIEKYVKKGSKVYVEGAQKTRKWQDKNGVDRWSTETVLRAFNGQIVLLDKAGGNFQPAGSAEDYGSSRALDNEPSRDSPPPATYVDDGKPFDQEIPF
jgi:single-strand DNA-binding protein